MAENVGSEFHSENQVLAACRYALAKEIAFDPSVRQSLRAHFVSNATVSTEPTKRGQKDIDRMHPYWRFKRLVHKPIGKMKGVDFLHILTAEKKTIDHIIHWHTPSRPRRTGF
eukprot:TRINITY_DN3820_c0_g2_i1.p1 TRINITY_DN3820_c0_g2~~TRINITY_DN3820_c0_g2_i1.p1  ORF type:complete len:125 (+),score=26.32 TRINITY_DN3820_c0_g2_i1:39-377(+)